MFSYYNHLGFNNPYFFDQKGTFIIKQKLSDLLSEFDGVRRIDPVAVIELLNKNYMFGDRTLIQGICRTPWLAKPDELLKKWEFYSGPKHDLIDINEEEIARTLFQKICSEIQLCIGEKEKVGLLLSGGMDSRIVAGTLDHLMKTNKLENIEVTAMTWGNEGTRDVVYAKEIALRLNWKWKHYTVTAIDLLNNIKETAIHGCEYSPIHLHAIPQIRDDNNLDIILAGSYGDSIGRAEYSGKNVRYLKPVLRGISSLRRIIYQSVFENSIKYIENDVHRYHIQFPEKEPYMQYELDYQLHYMRRMLNPCMELLTEKMNFYQVFTHPDIFGYIWSINPERRNSLVYKYMLQEFITKLDDIPWARTGLPFGQEKGTPDLYLKDHHSYANIIKNEILNKIETLIISNEIKKLRIFNQGGLKQLVNLVKFFPSKDLIYPEKLIWLASLAEMTKIYNIQGLDYKNPNQYWSENNLLSVPIEYFITQIKNLITTILKRMSN